MDTVARSSSIIARAMRRSSWRDPSCILRADRSLRSRSYCVGEGRGGQGRLVENALALHRAGQDRVGLGVENAARQETMPAV